MTHSPLGRLKGAALSLLLIAALATFAAAQDKAKPKLAVGSAAPAIKAAKWVKGKKVEKFEKNKVYVVEFWATWCGPCKVSIPHLTEIAKKFKDKVTVIGVDIWEDDSDDEKTTHANVEKFVKEMGAKMDYNVCIDTADTFMAKNWMDAAGEDGIPSAFVIDQDGKIAWIGHPMDEMDKVLEKVVAKKWNAQEEAKKKAEEEKKSEELQGKFVKAAELMESGDYKEAVKLFDEVYAASPEIGKNFLMPMILDCMVQYDEPAAYQRLKGWLDKGEITSPETMNEIAWNMMTEARFKKPDLPLALKLAEKAVEKTESKDGMIMDTLALAHYKSGNIDKAIDFQTKAVAIVKKMIADDPSLKSRLGETLSEMEARLESFKKAKGG